MKGNLVMRSLSKCSKKYIIYYPGSVRLRLESSIFKSHLYLVDSIISDIVHV